MTGSTRPRFPSPASQGPSPRLLNLRQAAEYLGVSFWSVRDYVLAGILPSVQLPALRPREGERPRQTLRRVLVDVADLDAFIAQHKVGAVDSQSSASPKTPGNTADTREFSGVCPKRARVDQAGVPPRRSTQTTARARSSIEPTALSQQGTEGVSLVSPAGDTPARRGDGREDAAVASPDSPGATS